TENEVLASVTDPLVDAVRLNDLEMELSFAEAEVTRLESLIRATEEIAETLENRSQRFTERQIRDIELQLEHARDRLALYGVDADEDAAEQDASLAGNAASAAESLARQEVDLLENALAAARNGVFVGDGYNDAPNAEQRRVELVTVLDGFNADLVAAQARRAAIADRVDDARFSVNRLTEDEIEATTNGRIWEVLASDGERLQRGEPILRIVDCDALLVTLSVTENNYNSLRVGDTGQFRLSGSGEVYTGTVTRLAGAGAGTIYQNLAVAPSAEHLERFDVAMAVSGLETDSELSCPVGRTGRVFFEDRPLDWLRSVF
uniref:HlyD family efflux transporter periplasmic adaptor subunit n=1 Tax=Marivita sp. TaxID=2003365 RepID=UPI0025BFDCE2